MPYFRMPLSGDVTQSINPWSWAFKFAQSQVGLVNINLGKSADPELEQQVLDEVGSYGRQLGRIGDVLSVLIKHVKLDELSDAEREAIRAFQQQLDEISRLKKSRQDIQ